MSLAETLLETQPQKFGLWPSVWKLLRLRARISFNGFKRSKTITKILVVVLLLVLLGLMVGLFLVSGLILSFLRSPELAQYVNPTDFINALPVLVLTAAFFLTLMTNFGVLLQSLYLSRDMDFLVAAPLPMRAVFLSKLLEAILPNFALFCAFSLPVLFGLGTSSGYNILYYPLLVVMMALLALAAGGLASILVMAVVRVVPARRVAEVLGFLGAMLSILCGQSGNLMQGLGIKQADVSGALTAFTRINAPWSPLAWAGRGLLAIGRNEWPAGLGLSLLSLLLAAGIFAGTLLLAERLYYTGWASMQGVARRKRPVRPALRGTTVGTIPAVTGAPAAASRRFPNLIPAAIKGLVVKDLLLLRRDPRNLSQLITPLIVGFAMLFSTQGGQRAATGSLTRLGLQNLDVYAVTILSVFVGWMLLINLALLAFTREGRNYWLLKVAPVRSLYLLAGKYLVSYLPALVISLVYLVLASLLRSVNLAYLPYSVLVITGVTAGANGISLAFGTAGANLEWDNVNRQRTRGTTGCFAFIFVSLFVVVDLALFLGVPALWEVFTGRSPLLAYVIGMAAGWLPALAAVFIPLRVVRSRVAHIGEAD